MTREFAEADIHRKQRIDTAKLRTGIDGTRLDVVLCDYVMPHLSLPGVLMHCITKGLDIRSLSSRADRRGYRDSRRCEPRQRLHNEGQLEAARLRSRREITEASSRRIAVS